MNKVITITGAGGTVGMSLTKYFLKTNSKIEIRAIERSESATSQLIDLAIENKNLKVFLVDLVSYSDIEKILEGSNIVIHCAALKHVLVGSMFPEELAHQNITCFYNIVKAAKRHGVEKILLCSTDKAATPTSVMGASKLLLEKIACFSSDEFSKFSSVRFGNILNSSGSIMPKIVARLKNRERIDINHKDMTRYLLTKNDFLNLINYAVDNMKGGEIFIPKAKTFRVSDLVLSMIDLFCQKHNVLSEEIVVRFLDNPHGENIEEKMINHSESSLVQESGNYFILKPAKYSGIKKRQNKLHLSLLSSSNNNLSRQEIDDLIRELEII